MLDRVFWLHSRINHEECIRVVMSVKGWEITIDKTDILKSDDNMLTILRAKGGITVVNPNEIIMICTMSKRSVLL
jgi:hypothetical protein